MTKTEIHVLLIEDEKTLHENFDKEAEIFSDSDDEINIVTTCVSTIEDAEAALVNRRFDAIVTDLKIEPGTVERDSVTIGNDFIKKLKGISPCPIAVLTGKPTDVEDSALDRSSMEKFTKESDAETKIFNWIKTKANLITLMRQSFKILNIELAPMFHGGVASRISAGDVSIPAEAALRMILENVADSILTVNSTSSSHPQECFIYPVRRNKIMTGDIINIDDEKWIILTPACDIVRCNEEYPIIIAKCNGHTSYSKYLEKAKSGDNTSLVRLINQANNLSTHFFPPLHKGEDPFIIDFATLSTKKYSELYVSNVIAAVSPKFLPNLIHRFSSYIGRPGAPDIDPTHCYEHSIK